MADDEIPEDKKIIVTKRRNIKPLVDVVLGKKLRLLVFVQECQDIDCPIRDICNYIQKGRCKFEHYFLRDMYNTWVDPKDGVGDVLTQVQLDMIGIHIMPLYQQLIKFQRDIMAIQKTTYLDRKGNHHPYPQFKEYRDLIKIISEELKRCGLEAAWKNKFHDKKPIPVGDMSKGVMETGRPGAYEEMAAGGTSTFSDDDEEGLPEEDQ